MSPQASPVFALDLANMHIADQNRGARERSQTVDALRGRRWHLGRKTS